MYTSDLMRQRLAVLHIYAVIYAHLIATQHNHSLLPVALGSYPMLATLKPPLEHSGICCLTQGHHNIAALACFPNRDVQHSLLPKQIKIEIDLQNLH